MNERVHQQIEAFHESLEEVLKHVLKAIYGRGWNTKAAADMFGGCTDVTQKGAWLKNALNPERNEKLGPSEVMWILRKGREHNVHDAMVFITDEASYHRTTPITPEERRDALHEEASTLVARLESLTRELARVK